MKSMETNTGWNVTWETPTRTYFQHPGIPDLDAKQFDRPVPLGVAVEANVPEPLTHAIADALGEAFALGQLHGRYTLQVQLHNLITPLK